mgnify:CR=1 FL=1|jgi:hypothetical protein
MKLFAHVMIISLAVLLLQNCSSAPPPKPIPKGSPDHVGIVGPGPLPKSLPAYTRKFSDDWKERFSANLAPAQEAYCLTQKNKDAFTVFKDWVFIVNSSPRKFGILKIIGLETSCAVFPTKVDNTVNIENLEPGMIIIGDGQIEKDGLINLWKFVKIK